MQLSGRCSGDTSPAAASPSLKRAELYGTDQPVTELFGRQCLLARRLAERGVRFIQLFDAPKNNAWDHHSGLREDLPKRCAAVDQPIAALLRDLKERGLLEDTLVVWGGEFGRTPTAEGTNGREHHPFGFTMWLAGGGIRGGIVHGATDDFGWHAVENKVHVPDLHATLFHVMGLDSYAADISLRRTRLSADGRFWKRRSLHFDLAQASKLPSQRYSMSV